MSDDLTIKPKMQLKEKKASWGIAGVFATRMLGLFMIFPVFVLFAQQEFKNITGLQIGIAMGIYGLTQALLQIPYGMLSDKYGRKPLIIIGMLVFTLGSIICATAESIEMIIIGRAIQGMGAVAAVLMATVSDVVCEQFRLRTMSIVGITIGLSFTLSLILGPVLAVFIGVRGIFWVIALLALIGILLVIYAIPTIKNQHYQREAEADPKQFKDVLQNIELVRLDVGVFVLHAILTGMFVVLPLMIRDNAGLDSLHHWKLYLPVMLISFVLIIPFILIAEKQGKIKQVYLGTIATLIISQCLFIFMHDGKWELFIALLIFFTSFNLLEASLPSLVVKFSPADKKGTASGIYSTSQFLGAAFGGIMGGYFYQHYGYNGVFTFTITLLFLWLFFASKMQTPLPLSITSIKLNPIHRFNNDNTLVQEFLKQDGVHQVVVLREDKRIYFKINRKKTNKANLTNFLNDLSKS